LRVTLLLNIQRKRGDNTASEQLVRRFFWKTDWPGSSHPSVFYDSRALDPDGPSGVLHAKAVVADNEAVFITSANLTEAALDRNIELGIFVRNRAFALTTCTYFRALIHQHLLKPLPLSQNPSVAPGGNLSRVEVWVSRSQASDNRPAQIASGIRVCMQPADALH
jgi:phosphatidylserine/phosphatidylglycerophosphate/cardiolipin synthase-like enzyme